MSAEACTALSRNRVLRLALPQAMHRVEKMAVLHCIDADCSEPVFTALQATTRFAVAEQVEFTTEVEHALRIKHTARWRRREQYAGNQVHGFARGNMGTHEIYNDDRFPADMGWTLLTYYTEGLLNMLGSDARICVRVGAGLTRRGC